MIHIRKFESSEEKLEAVEAAVMRLSENVSCKTKLRTSQEQGW